MESRHTTHSRVEGSMSVAEKMLEASPTGVELGVAAVAAAVDACADTAQACTSCADSCLAEDEVAALRRCITLCQNCADICVTTVRTLCRQLGFDRAGARQLTRDMRARVRELRRGVRRACRA